MNHEEQEALRARWKRPDVTPGVSEVTKIIDDMGLLGEPDGKFLEQALLRAFASTPAPVLDLVRQAHQRSSRPLRGWLTRLLGRMVAEHGDMGSHHFLCELVEDDDLKTALNAIHALGSLPGEVSERTLLRVWEKYPLGARKPEIGRALIRALGKAGSHKARQALQSIPSSEAGPHHLDPETLRLLGQATLILDRTVARQAESAVRTPLSALPGASYILHTRRGLESFVQDEVKELMGRSHVPMEIVAPGCLVVEGRYLGPDAPEVLAKVRTAERWAFLLGQHLGGGTDGPQVEEQVAAILSEPQLISWLKAKTQGAIRYRIAWREASNARMWRLVTHLSKVSPQLVNDPTKSLWELGVMAFGSRGFALELTAKGLTDTRFAYREKTVPASSHGPLAAALVRVAGIREDDLVWDPFCGAGTELMERALRGPYQSLWGTDLDAHAVAMAQANFRKAGLEHVHLVQADALTWNGIRPTLTITNPPLGRRVARGTAKELLIRAGTHIAGTLAPGGRLVWVSPFPAITARLLESQGLKVIFRQTVDVGGFDAEIQCALAKSLS